MRNSIIGVGACLLCLLVGAMLWTRVTGLKPDTAVGPISNALQLDYSTAAKSPVAEGVHIVETSTGFTIAGLPKAPDAGPGWKSPANPVISSFPKSFADTMRVKSGSAEVSATPVGGKEARGCIASDGSLVYKDAFAGCDVKYVCSAYKTEEYIIVRDEHAQRSWSWNLDLKDSALQSRLTAAHTIEFVDAHRTPRLRINAPEGKEVP